MAATKSCKGMLPVIKLLFPMLAAALVGACGLSSVGDGASGKLPMGGGSPQPAAQQSSQPNAARDQEAAGKIALSLASVADPASKSYKIGPRDVLEITVFKAPELSKTVQVSEAGTINFPLIGELDAAGKTAREIEQEMTRTLGSKYLQNPQISVFVKEYFSQRVTVEGAVKKPGVFPIAGGLSLLQAIAQAQGFDEIASHTVILLRQENGTRLAAKYDVSSIQNGSAEDPQLQAGDVIDVPTSEVKEGVGFLVKFLPLAGLAPYL